jgi:hypothetical protein
MEHHQWMTSTISSSRQQQRPVNLVGQETDKPIPSPDTISNDVDSFSATYKAEYDGQRLPSRQGEDNSPSLEENSIHAFDSHGNIDQVLDSNFNDTRNSGFENKINDAFDSEVSGYNSIDYSEDELGFQLTVESSTYSVVLPTVSAESSSVRHRVQSSSTKSNKGQHPKKPKTSSSAEVLPSIQNPQSSHHASSNRAATADKLPSAAEIRTNKLLSKAYAPLIPPYTQEEIEDMFAPKRKKRPMKQSKPIEPSLAGPASLQDDQSLQLSDPSVMDSFPILNGENSTQILHRSKDSAGLSPGLTPIHTEGSSSSISRRPRSPFNEEISVLKKPSEKLVANILVKARKAISASEEFQNRKITQTEIRLLDR